MLFFLFLNLFLIQTVFTTTTNQTVIQTYNLTTYQSCTMDDASDDDTFQYNGGNSEFNQSQTIAVPLTIEGSNYFFSDFDNGTQCQHGMAFDISVKHGLGLPPSLNQPPPPPHKEPPGPDAQSPPVSIKGGSPSEVNSAFGVGIDARVELSALFFGWAALLRFYRRNAWTAVGITTSLLGSGAAGSWSELGSAAAMVRGAAA